MKTLPVMNLKVDAYIAKAQPFAQPVLTHIRELMHQACPDIEEAIKWGMPFFTLHGVIVGNMAAFKQHCSLGLWGPEMAAILGKDGEKPGGAMGSFGRIESVKDLPPDKVLLGYFRQAAGLVASGERTKSLLPRVKAEAAKPAPAVPEELAAALRKNKKAAAAFAAFSPSCKREYGVDHRGQARGNTSKRVAQAVEWIAEGKQRNWKYQNC